MYIVAPRHSVAKHVATAKRATHAIVAKRVARPAACGPGHDAPRRPEGL